MSTHLYEMEHLVTIVNNQGGNAELIKDEEGRIESISVTGLMGFRDRNDSPLVVVEALRSLIGREAHKIPLSRDKNNNPMYNVSLSQSRAYGGGEAMLKGMVYSNRIPINTKFLLRHPVDFEGEDIQVDHCANIEGQFVKFDSKEAFDAYDPAIITTQLRTYRYDISNDEQAIAYHKETRELEYAGIKPDVMKTASVPQSEAFNEIRALKDSDVFLHKDSFKNGKWLSVVEGTHDAKNSLSNWGEKELINTNIKTGYYLEQTDSMKQIRRSLDNPSSMRY